MLCLDKELWPWAVALWLAQSLLVAMLWWRGVVTTRGVIVVAVLMRLAVAWLPPSLSDDAYRYLWDGLVTTGGQSPYVLTPVEDGATAATPAGAIALEKMNSPRYYSVYPPISQGVFAVGGAAARLTGSALVGLFAIKLVVASAELVGLLLLARLVEARALLLYAWQPLVIFETAGQGHTEALVVPL
ncbi:MAG: hypothetical protein AAGK78_09790, partial [Planctomycetota bacterium]